MDFDIDSQECSLRVRFFFIKIAQTVLTTAAGILK